MIEFECKFLECDIPTINKRVYPKIEIKKALRLTRFPLFGEMGSNLTCEPTPSSKASHELVDCHFDGNTLIGDFRTLNTHAGQELEFLLSNGWFDLNCYMAPRGIGFISTDTDGNKVVTDYLLLAVDLYRREVT